MSKSEAVERTCIGVLLLAVAVFCIYISMDQVRRNGRLVYNGPVAVFGGLVFGAIGLAMVGWGIGTHVTTGLLIACIPLTVITSLAWWQRRALSKWSAEWWRRTTMSQQL